MAYPPRTSATFSPGRVPQGVKWLLIANIAIFVLNYLAALQNADRLFMPLGLIPADVLLDFHIWQPVTYMFMHDVGGFGHILFNMLTLWMFGADLERTWGTRRFLNYYFLCGIGAALCVIAVNLVFAQMGDARGFVGRTIGSSGAIYGLLMAFGLLYPNREILFSFLFPVKAKYFVMILGAIAFLSSLSASATGVSHIAHLGGMIFGFFYLKSRLIRGKALRLDPSAAINRWYQDYKLQRAKRKFQVYLRKRDSERDRVQ